jgi:hypothetical protein
MPLVLQKDRPTPDFWQIHGHSWFQFQTGPSGDQTGRTDALFRSAMDIEYTGWRNRALSGARICANGRNLGGWSRAITARGITNRSAPYAPDGGATVLCWAINDMGQYGGQNATARQTIVDTHRACISRCRASSTWDVSTAKWTFSNWGSVAGGLDLSSAGTTRQCTVTTANNATFTIPADYTGETLVFGFLLRPGSTGGTVTFSGTAGLTGTFATGGGGQSSTEHAYTVKRFTTLTSANAGQTVIITCTALDTTAPSVFLDAAWVESKTPPPVIVCDLAKSATGSGYGYYNAFYNTWSASSTRSEASMDADVDAYNTLLYSMIGEFDGMVQPAYMDQAINPGGVKGVATKTSDGIHPNELGAGAVVDALVDARNRMTPPATAFGYTLSFNGPSPRAGQLQRPHPLVTPYHTFEVTNATFSAAAPTAGTLWAFPFIITEARSTYMNLAVEVVAAGTVTATVRWGIYDDVDWVGYPQQQVPSTDTTTSAALSLPLSVGVKDSANMVSGFGMVADPGLYWLAIKCDAAGTGQTWRLVAGHTLLVPQRIAAATNPALYTGWAITGQGTTALATQFPSGAVPTAGPAPALMIKRSK